MCLDIVRRTFSGRSKEIFTGWKAFRLIPEGKIRFEYGFLGDNREMPRGKWVKATPEQCSLSDDKYVRGFHVFVNKDSAKNWARIHIWSDETAVILRVRCRGLLAEGVESRIESKNEAKVFMELYVPRQKKS